MATETEHIPHIERPPRSLWDRLLAEPERAPEHIALVAAERFGPQAEEWVRIAGHGHTPEELAKVAYRKHVRLARVEGGLLGVGGAITAAPDGAARPGGRLPPPGGGGGGAGGKGKADGSGDGGEGALLSQRGPPPPAP